MKASLSNRNLWLTRIAILMLAGATFSSRFAIAQAAQSESIQAQAVQSQIDHVPFERFWLAGRYDGNRVIVYFDAVKFDRTVPSIAERLTDPVVAGFFMPKKLPWSYIAKFQKRPDAEQFKVGDKYDLLMDCGMAVPVTLTTMIGTEGDEEVGNDSYIGALATPSNSEHLLLFSNSFYVLRRHRELGSGQPYPPKVPAVCGGLERDPVRFDIQTQIVELLTQRMKATATDAERLAAENVSPILRVQAFHLADGGLRYYAAASWNVGQGENIKSAYALAAWISPSPRLHVLEVQRSTSAYESLDSLLPELLNVVDLGDGKTGIILSIAGEDSASTRLLEYRDGLDFQHMRVLQSLEVGE